MRMIVFGIIILPLFASAAIARPVQLTETQMDRVTAGESLASFRIDPILVPGGNLIAKNQADAMIAAIFTQYLQLVLPRMGTSGS